MFEVVTKPRYFTIPPHVCSGVASTEYHLNWWRKGVHVLFIVKCCADCVLLCRANNDGVYDFVM